MKKLVRFFILFSLSVLMASPQTLVHAQEGGGQEPVYIVQEGDSLWGIAQRFGITMDNLTNANGIVDANQLTVGMQLRIPGLEGLQGVLVTEKVPYGASLESLSTKYQIPLETLARLNKIVNPDSLYAGANLVLVEQNAPEQQTEFSDQNAAALLKPGETLLDFAAQRGRNPWQVALLNGMEHTWEANPSQTLLPSLQSAPGFSEIPYPITKLQVFRLPLGQGKTATIRLTLEGTKPEDVTLGGSLAGKPLHFFSQPFTDAAGQVTATEFIALQGVENFIDPGFFPMVLEITWKGTDGSADSRFSFAQALFVADSKYEYDPPLKVTDEELLDPTKTQPEEDQLLSMNTVMTQEKYWTGGFRSPVDPQFTDCWPSTFGRRRSYNGSNYTYIHSGLDFCGQVGNNIYAPARGKVVFSGETFVRGNTTVIDHGWGVFTVYGHQDQILVKTGDVVELGQEIGKVGETGRVTGPHLHWEVWVGGVRVDPYDWLLTEYPQSDVDVTG